MRVLEKAIRWFAQAGLIAGLMFASALAPAQTVTDFHNDVSGTPVLATDASGNVVWKENYRPYGDRLNNPSAEAGNAIGFAGKPFDANTGLSYMGARYYDPGVGRFMGVDAAPADPGSVHGFNRYAYANNNPYKYVDPDGHSPIDVAFLVFDLGKLGVAIYTGVGVGGAVADVALSTLGVVSPVPGVGEVLKGARAIEHGIGAVRGAEKTAEVAKAAKGAAEGKTVLGHFPEYKQLGEGLSARTFNVPEAVWNKMSEAERWGANQKFLDRMISRGDQVILSTPLDKVRPGSYFARELEYMGSKGYVPSADGTRLIKP